MPPRQRASRASGASRPVLPPGLRHGRNAGGGTAAAGPGACRCQYQAFAGTAKVERRSEAPDVMRFGRWATRYFEFKSDAKSGSERFADSTLALRRSIYDRLLAGPFGKPDRDEIKSVALGDLLDPVKKARGLGLASMCRSSFVTRHSAATSQAASGAGRLRHEPTKRRLACPSRPVPGVAYTLSPARSSSRGAPPRRTRRRSGSPRRRPPGAAWCRCGVRPWRSRRRRRSPACRSAP